MKKMLILLATAMIALTFALGCSPSVAEPDGIEEPVQLEEIDVWITVEPTYLFGSVFFDIKSNLPDGTGLSLSLDGDNYSEQDYGSFNRGRYISETFGDSISGLYTLTIKTPTNSILPDSIKEVIGERGEALTGDLIVEVDVQVGIGGYRGNQAIATFEFDFS
jgi:hypothetical protein